MPIKDLFHRLIQRLRALFSGRPAGAAIESPPPRAALPTSTASAASPAAGAGEGAVSEIAITIASDEGATTPAPSERADAAPPAVAAQVAAPPAGAEAGVDASPTPLRREQRADAAPSATTPEADAPQRRPRLRLVEDRRPSKPRRRPAPALDPAIAAVPVRRFFSRLVARDAAPLTAASWPSLQVERFFLAIAEPSPALRRGPAIAEPKVLEDAFADFVWE